MHGSFYRRGRTLQRRSIKRGRARSQARARTRIGREQGTNKSKEAVDRTISRTANRRSFSIDRLVKIQRATSSSSSTPSSLSPSHHHDHHLIIINTGIIITLQTRPKPSHTTSPIYKKPLDTLSSSPSPCINQNHRREPDTIQPESSHQRPQATVINDAVPLTQSILKPLPTPVTFLKNIIHIPNTLLPHKFPIATIQHASSRSRPQSARKSSTYVIQFLTSLPNHEVRSFL